MSTNIDIDSLLSGKNPNRFRKVLIFLVVISLIGSYFIYDYINNDNEKAVFETITTEHIVEKTNLTTTVEAASTIIAKEQLQTKFNTSGTVSEIYVSIGDNVEKDQPLAKLINNDSERTLNRAKISLQEAELILQEQTQPLSALETASNSQSIITAQSQVLNAQIALDNILAGATNLQKSSMEYDLATAKQQVNNAKITLENLTKSNLETATNISTQEKAVITASRQLDTTLASLRVARQNYCTSNQTSGVDVCGSDDIPLTDIKVAALNNQINNVNAITNNLYSLTTSLLQSDASYKNALDNHKLQKQLLDEAKVSSQESLDVAEKRLQNKNDQNTDLLAEPTTEELQQANNTLDQAQASLTVANARNTEDLAGLSEIDIKQLQFSIEKAKITLEEAEETINDLTLKAPFTGTIGSVDIVLGQNVTANTNAFILSNLDSISIDMNISETDLPNIKTGQFGIANFNALPEQSYLFEISTISFIPEVSQGVVSYPVKANIINRNNIESLNMENLQPILTSLGISTEERTEGRTEGSGNRNEGLQKLQACVEKVIGTSISTRRDIANLTPEQRTQIQEAGCLELMQSGGNRSERGANRSTQQVDSFRSLLNTTPPHIGMNGSVTIITEIKLDVLVVPSKSIKEDDGKSYVLLQNETTKTSEKQFITTGFTDVSQTEITSGLEEGNIILIESQIVSSTADTAGEKEKEDTSLETPNIRRIR
ncbi:MAG: efflux RND transporter periplasmic adaptor subunit [Dehalococcoidia bacterium]|nr:efflux RND transporter periplasmic adaptor subunit [Dehalococcoidia bacterium]